MILSRANQYVLHSSYKFAQFRKININLIKFWMWFFDPQERHTIPYHQNPQMNARKKSLTLQKFKHFTFVQQKMLPRSHIQIIFEQFFKAT